MQVFIRPIISRRQLISIQQQLAAALATRLHIQGETAHMTACMSNRLSHLSQRPIVCFPSFAIVCILATFKLHTVAAISQHHYSLKCVLLQQAATY